jgi:hypothetical protein
MIPVFRLKLARAKFPEIAMGESDARRGVWRDIVGNDRSFAYEIGRMLAMERCHELGGQLYAPPYVERAINQLWG